MAYDTTAKLASFWTFVVQCKLWHVVAPLRQLLRCIMDQIRCVGLLECICASGAPIESTYYTKYQVCTCWVKLGIWSHTFSYHSIGTNSTCKCVKNVHSCNKTRTKKYIVKLVLTTSHLTYNKVDNANILSYYTNEHFSHICI